MLFPNVCMGLHIFFSPVKGCAKPLEKVKPMSSNQTNCMFMLIELFKYMGGGVYSLFRTQVCA